MYSEPVSNEKELFIEVPNYNTINLSSIIEQAQAHFGCVTVDEIVISPERHQVEGCSCCYDDSDYRQYLCVTIEKE